MAIDILALLRRDHEDLSRGLAALMNPDATIQQIRTALDGARLGLTAHAEAEDIVFAHAVRSSKEPRALALDAYRKRAGRFATERLRQLSMMAPSAPVYLPESVRRIAVGARR